MEELNPLAITHLLQHTLRSLCLNENSQWVYAVFWRVLPRNYPPPKWEGQGVYERSRGNRRNWILVWEDGFCNFAASTAVEPAGECQEGSSAYGNCEFPHYQGLQPELFFKMSHEIYNYGEGLIGKVAADYSHKWVYKEPSDQEINFLSSWHNTADSQPRTWEAQFQSGIKTIALIAVREGVVQLGSLHKAVEDLNYVVLLRKKFSYIESIPGVLLPHPSSSPYPCKIDGPPYGAPPDAWQFQDAMLPPVANHHQFYDLSTCSASANQIPTMKITPSMSSLEALLSKLPSVVPPPPGYGSDQPPFVAPPRPLEFMGVAQKVTVTAKKEVGEEDYGQGSGSIGEDVGSSYSHLRHHHGHHYQDLNTTSSTTNNEF
ncbi:hypothetical protein SAY87_028868 [Trapa incisa]|uniref:Transcription factor MYC/MYB N-terminal domain-containing protein n=1 Tax=Trapa incisa TaxID=236973 RepID=A0AAN7KYL2_9MYRT|nr:hypothetical protein SAY87_028868 [Trapa incisa]